MNLRVGCQYIVDFWPLFFELGCHPTMASEVHGLGFAVVTFLFSYREENVGFQREFFGSLLMRESLSLVTRLFVHRLMGGFQPIPAFW